MLALIGRTDLGDSPEVRAAFPFDPRLVPQTRDLFNLFDTTADLSGADIDIAPFIRDGEDLDVLVFWRDDDSGLGPREMRKGRPFKKLLPTRDELCPVGAWCFREFLKGLKPQASQRVWVRDWRKGWMPVDSERIYPGQLVLLHKDVGGYDPLEGWNGDAGSIPEPCRATTMTDSPNHEGGPSSGDFTLDDEENAVARWQSVHGHSIDVARELAVILADAAIAAGLASADLVKPLGYGRHGTTWVRLSRNSRRS